MSETQVRTVVAATSMGTTNIPVIVCSDGAVFAWLPITHNLTPMQLAQVATGGLQAPHGWQEFHQAIPGTERAVQMEG